MRGGVTLTPHRSGLKQQSHPMPSRRLARIAQAVKQEVSTTILFELRDPRIRNVTVLDVQVSPDIRSAKVYVSVMGEPREQALTMHGLESARGFLQSKVADRIQTRYTPILTFVLDQGVKKSIEASRILRDTVGPESSSDAASGFEPDDAEQEFGDDRLDDLDDEDAGEDLRDELADH